MFPMPFPRPSDRRRENSTGQANWWPIWPLDFPAKIPSYFVGTLIDSLGDLYLIQIEILTRKRGGRSGKRGRSGKEGEYLLRNMSGANAGWKWLTRGWWCLLTDFLNVDECHESPRYPPSLPPSSPPPHFPLKSLLVVFKRDAFSSEWRWQCGQGEIGHRPHKMPSWEDVMGVRQAGRAQVAQVVSPFNYPLDMPLMPINTSSPLISRPVPILFHAARRGKWSFLWKPSRAAAGHEWKGGIS